MNRRPFTPALPQESSTHAYELGTTGITTVEIALSLT